MATDTEQLITADRDTRAPLFLVLTGAVVYEHGREEGQRQDTFANFARGEPVALFFGRAIIRQISTMLLGAIDGHRQCANAEYTRICCG